MINKLGDSPSARKHLFISYAWEDSAFAEWLAKTLTREGYNVWIDKMKLLGGEPFPSDIEKAIADGAFRVLALMSQSSLNKTSPRRERMLADKAGKALDLKDFIIPLIVDDLSPDRLDFVTTELTALRFTENWNEGLKLLLKKLEKIEAPRDPSSGPRRLSNLLLEQPSCYSSKSETLTSNLFEIKNIPKKLLYYQQVKKTSHEPADTDWAFYQTDNGMWSQSEPPIPFGDSLKLVKTIDWEDHPQTDGIIPRNVVVNLISKALRNHCIAKGLSYSIEDRSLKFLPGFLEKDKIKFVNYNLKKSTVLVEVPPLTKPLESSGFKRLVV